MCVDDKRLLESFTAINWTYLTGENHHVKLGIEYNDAILLSYETVTEREQE